MKHGEQTFVTVVLEEHCKTFHLDKMIKMVVPDSIILQTHPHKRGAALTCLKAFEDPETGEILRKDIPLIVANSDQLLTWDISHFLYCMESESVLCGIVTFDNVHPMWSYVEKEDNDNIKKIHEKIPVSNIAIAGVYYWKHPSQFFESCTKALDTITHREVYTSDVLNVFIDSYGGDRIKLYHISKVLPLGITE